jgi:hypothetical protein
MYRCNKLLLKESSKVVDIEFWTMALLDDRAKRDVLAGKQCD